MSGSKALGGARRRRTRCRRCQACMRTECGECHFCKDMKKFGGPGRMKQSCLLRQCTAPVLPHTAVCLSCGEAGKEDTVDSEEEKFSLSLMECTICNEIIHPGCLKMGKAEGIINDEIPNCWECPKCHKEGKTSKDQADGSGKRRMDNGEVGRWKLTDDPPPNKKKTVSSEDGGRQDGHKRKKEKELPQDSGPKKKMKGGKEKHLKKVLLSVRLRGGGRRPVPDQRPAASQPADQRSHQREKLERFKRMCQLLERVQESSSSSSSSSESDSASDSHSSSEACGSSEPASRSPTAGAAGAAAATAAASARERNRERYRRLAELGFSASDDSDATAAAARRRTARAGPRGPAGGATPSPAAARPAAEEAEDKEEERGGNPLAPRLPLSSTQPSPSSTHTPLILQDGAAAPASTATARRRATAAPGPGARPGRPGEEHGGGPTTGAAKGEPRSKLHGGRQAQQRSSTNGGGGGGPGPRRQLHHELDHREPHGRRLLAPPVPPGPRSQVLKRSPPPCPRPRPVQMERHLVRPPPACPEPHCLPLDCGKAHVMPRDVWLRVFQHLSQRELCVCMRVCRTWSRWCCDKRLWTQIDLSGQRSITPPMLSGIIRRQPISLDLGCTNISKKQLMWLINRLQGLQELNVSGCPWSCVSALCQATCPCLRLLDLSRVEDLKDSNLRELLAPPADARAGHSENRGRFQNVTELRLAGLEVTDGSSRLLVRYLPHLAKLDLSQCCNVTDQTVQTLTSPISPLRDSLTHINLAGCVKVTEQSLPLLRRCSSLQCVDLRSCCLVAPEACQLLPFSCPEDRLLLKNS
ncbi:hypothetical protein ANANG_G00295760 [Anguilla anguilla]|uniref:F-box/LRR-repeat protein 19 n=1 Tax=Anguilla anguilla TaxID=7936 RepID=A0A9D3LNR1_ANGAN|nr:hypothetical protein ANANG_G00295760 [Anguilla anguilla]